MILVLIKYFSISMSALYIFNKSIGKKIDVRKSVIYTFFSLVIAFCIYFIKSAFPAAIFAFYVISAVVLLFVLFKKPLNITISVSIISFSISYTLYLLAIVINFPIGIFISPNIENPELIKLISFTSIGITQNILSFLIFKIKRFKNGIPLIEEFANSEIVLFFGVTLLFLASVFTIRAENDIYFLIPVFVIACLGIALLFWWKKKTDDAYKKCIIERESKIIADTLVARQSEIATLQDENERLSKIIHRDNKIIPAMQSAVRSVVLGSSKEAANCLLHDLEEIAKERKGLLSNCEECHTKIPKTGSAAFDAIIEYMRNKAVAEGTDFGFSNMCGSDFIPESVISRTELSTLAADLLENALIAVSYVKTKQVLIAVGIIDGFYEVSVFDSGIPFEDKTLANFGKKRASTHKDKGGSGIGLMTLSEITKRNSASFIIEPITSGGYTKKVSVLFDGNQQVILSSSCKNAAKAVQQEKICI